MSTPQVDALPLDFNACVAATFDMMLQENAYMTKARILKHLQNVCIAYACLAVKRNDGVVGEKAKQKDAATGFREVAVPGFLQWAKDNGVSLPQWLTGDMLGRSTMGGAPILFTNGDRLWKRFCQAIREMKRDFNPIWDRFVKGQPGGTLPSGHVPRDAMENLLNGLHHKTTSSGGSDSPVSLEEDALFMPHGGTIPPRPATDGARGEGGQGGGGEGGKEHDRGGAADKENDGGKAGNIEGGGVGRGEEGIKQEPAAGDGEEEFAGENIPSDDEEDSLYPDRPEGWMHQYTLIFCLIGRPSKSEDIDLATVRKTSGPPGRPSKRKGHPSNGGDSIEVLSPSEGSGGILTSTAIRMFAGAGEAQSRAKVKEETAAVAHRNAQISNQSKIAGAVESLAAIVGRREVLDTRADALAQEAAARSRKEDELKALRGELEFTEENTARWLVLRGMLTHAYRKPVSSYAIAVAPPSSAATTPPRTAQPMLPGFTGAVGASADGSEAGGSSGGDPSIEGTNERSV